MFAEQRTRTRTIRYSCSCSFFGWAQILFVVRVRFSAGHIYCSLFGFVFRKGRFIVRCSGSFSDAAAIFNTMEQAAKRARPEAAPDVDEDMNDVASDSGEAGGEECGEGGDESGDEGEG